MTHTDLIRRLESGSGADRELDCLLAEKLLGFTHDGQPEPFRKWSERRCGSEYSGSASVMISAYTSSLDAALSLVERMLPGSFYFLAKGKVAPEEPLFAARIYKRDSVEDEDVIGEAEHDDLPRATLIALLRALDQEPHP